MLSQIKSQVVQCMPSVLLPYARHVYRFVFSRFSQPKSSQATTSGGRLDLLDRSQAVKEQRMPWESAPQAELSILRIDFDGTVDGFVPLQPISVHPTMVKIVAFYHFDSLDKFDEAPKSALAGHIPRQLPLSHDSSWKDDVELARSHGITGFACVVHATSGHLIGAAKLRSVLGAQGAGFPFCVSWKSDGEYREQLDEVARLLAECFQDPSHLCIGGRPVVILDWVYAMHIPGTVSDLRRILMGMGCRKPYLIGPWCDGITPQHLGLDAYLDCPIREVQTNSQLRADDSSLASCGYRHDYNIVANRYMAKRRFANAFYYCVVPRYDGPSETGMPVLAYSTALRYRQWLSACVNQAVAANKASGEPPLVFIRAWNDWRNGCYLAPDRLLGCCNLLESSKVLIDYEKACHFSGLPRKRASQALCAHVFYEDTLTELVGCLDSCRPLQFDVYITVCSSEIYDLVQRMLPHAFVMLVDNRGRDILPFIRMLRILLPFGYEAVCKLHSKKTVFRSDGNFIRQRLYSELMGSFERTSRILQIFEQNPKVGIIAPQFTRTAPTADVMSSNIAGMAALLESISAPFVASDFVAGSMFWFRPQALYPLTLVYDGDFTFEDGWADGCFHHAVERVFSIIADRSGFNTIYIDP